VERTPNTHLTGGWVDPGAGLDVLNKEKPPALVGFEPRIDQRVATIAVLWTEIRTHNLSNEQCRLAHGQRYLFDKPSKISCLYTQRPHYNQ